MLILGGFSCYKRTISGNFDLTVCEIFKKKKKKNVSKIQSSRIFLIFQKQTFREVKKNNYFEKFREFLKKCEVMFLSVTVVVNSSKIGRSLNNNGGTQ